MYKFSKKEFQLKKKIFYTHVKVNVLNIKYGGFIL